MIPEKQFEHWIRKQVFIIADDGKCTKLVMRHVTSASRTGQIVLSVEVPEDVDDGWVTTTKEELINIAQADSEGIGGTQGYIILSYHGESATPSARFTIKMHSTADVDGDDISTEPPNQKGLLGQTMRHLEAVMRTSAMMQASTLSATQRMMGQQEMIIEKLIKEKFDNIDVVETLLSQKSDREIEQAKAAHALEMQDKIVDTVQLLLPVALNKLKGNGQKMLPEKASGIDQQIAAIADTITTDQLTKMQQVFEPAQLMAILDLFSQAKQKKENLVDDKTDNKQD